MSISSTISFQLHNIVSILFLFFYSSFSSYLSFIYVNLQFGYNIIISFVEYTFNNVNVHLKFPLFVIPFVDVYSIYIYHLYHCCWIHIPVINDIQCSIFMSFIISTRLLIDMIIILIVQFYDFIIDIVQVVLFYFILIVIIWCYIIPIALLLNSFPIVLCLKYLNFVLKVSIYSPIIN